MSTTAAPGTKGSGHSRVHSPARRTSVFKAALLAVASILFAMLLSEIGLRLFTQYGANAAASGKPADIREVKRYLTRIDEAPGTKRQWFTEDPPPLPNRSPVSAERLERYNDFKRRGIFAAQADYIWNRYYVESERCSPNHLFQAYPDKALVFDPPVASAHPRYRFPPNTTTVAGLVTNEFGLRGPPLTLAKPPRTVRIAFLGASTTVGFHHFSYSYPERVVHWLNRFAEAKHYDVRFEALNAGREGLNSEDIASIVRDELLPLAPDLAVYYEGANQFSTANEMVSPRVPPRQEIDLRDPIAGHKVPELIRAHLAMGNLLDHALNGFNFVGEPLKPAYRLTWPAGVDERNPDVDNPNLPLKLPIIVKNLDSIGNSLESIGGQLVLCSFEWLAKDRMPLSANRHQFIYKHLNTSLWPLRYADIRRLADFQNRVYRRYAATRGIPFLDVAESVPQDPNIFEDAIHMTEAGERLRAWIVFQQLVPIIRRKIESRQLPRPSGFRSLPPPPSLAVSEMPLACGNVPPSPRVRIDGAFSLDALALVYDKASIERGPPVKVTTAAQKWGFAAAIPIYIPANLTVPSFLYLRARVVKGQIGLGVTDRQTGAIEFERAVVPTTGMADIYMRVLYPARAGSLIIRSTADDGIPSEILIEDVALVAASKPARELLVQAIALERVQLAYQRASLERSRQGLVVTTGPESGAYAGIVPLGLDPTLGAGTSVHVRMRVLEGIVGIGILSADSKVFLMESSLWPSLKPVEITLRLPSPPITGDLVIRNGASGNVISKAILERIEVWRTP